MMGLTLLRCATLRWNLVGAGHQLRSVGYAALVCCSRSVLCGGSGFLASGIS